MSTPQHPITVIGAIKPVNQLDHRVRPLEARDADQAIRIMLRDSGSDQSETEGLKATDIRYVEGRAAIRYTKALRSLCAGEDVVELVKAADPTEGERRGLSYSEAEGICAEDPRLVRLEVAS